MGEAARVYGPPFLAWVALIGRLAIYRVRDPAEDRSKRLVLTYLGALAISFTLQAPGCYEAAGDLLGIPNAAKPLSHWTVLVAAWAARNLLVWMREGGEPVRLSWRLRFLVAGSVVGTGVLFLLADTPVNDVRYNALYGAEPLVLEYWLAYLVGLMPALLDLARLSWVNLCDAERPAVRLRLWMSTVGVVAIIAYHVHKGMFFLSRRFDLPYSNTFTAVMDKYLTLVAFVLVLLSASLPRLRVSGDGAVAGWLHRFTTYQRLRPLWLALYRANPQIALSPPRSALLERLDPRDIDLRLYRRVVEIRDGRLALRPYLDPDAEARIRARAVEEGKTGHQLDAAVEAEVLAAGLRARSAGEPPPNGPPHAAIHGGRDLDSDTEFLARVADAYAATRSARPRGGTSARSR
ncbi:MAB_1171c family putative transporter [Umezawaea sp.]|uniref:MAB_1171c family putative transporter n=1 Tax=Umezawaea sp. TaxID=1955258 RepID=UPI002ED227F5